MSIQLFIVLVLIAAAAIFSAGTLLRKGRSFSPKKDCGDNCGCSGASKKLTS